MNKLLDRALQADVRGRPLRKDANYKPEEIQALAVAWCNGEVSFHQVCVALKSHGSTVYNALALALKRGAMDKTIIIKKRK